MFSLSYMFYVQFCVISLQELPLLCFSRQGSSRGPGCTDARYWPEQAGRKKPCYATLTHEALQLFWETSESGRQRELKVLAGG